MASHDLVFTPAANEAAFGPVQLELQRGGQAALIASLPACSNQMQRRPRVASHGLQNFAPEVCSNHVINFDPSLVKLMCHATFKIPADPVIAEDGRVYDRSAITEWLRTNPRSPVTNEGMSSALLPAASLDRILYDMMQRQETDLAGLRTLRAIYEHQAKQEVLKLLKERAFSGSREAMFRLGWALWTGSGGADKDLHAAAYWFQKIVETRYVPANTEAEICALTIVGQALRFGQHGIKKNIQAGMEFLAEARSQWSLRAASEGGREFPAWGYDAVKIALQPASM